MKKFGAPVPGWTPATPPRAEVMEGHWARLEPLEAEAHAADLFRANSADDGIWDYLPYGPFSSAATYHRWVRDVQGKPDPMFFAIRNLETGHLGGVASYLRVAPEVGTIEVGHLNFAPELQGSRAATEAMALMMRWAFANGYRRYEWKCDSLNIPSRRAAQRLGFSYEGVFRQATIYKGRNRDTAWYAITDEDWPALSEAFRVWLSPGNFTADGRQIERLSDLTALVRVASDPVLG
ncbi:GNAT family protein [Frigidibacter sp. MR17.14]|uniref:GNAT family N-acetyltransferase n=1 Tax=Frigidibacter sp. MR17.14 TaxID=3126509 RepID=UPI003012B2D0